MADQDPRHIDRKAEEERQAKVPEAVDAIDWTIIGIGSNPIPGGSTGEKPALRADK